MKFLDMDLLSDFSGQYLRAALIVSLMSVWMLVGLFYYLNRYTKRDYFTVWTAAWLFYALWLTLGLKFEANSPDSLVFKLKQCCVAISAVFLVMGQLAVLENPGPADLVRPVHLVPAGLDVCRPEDHFRGGGRPRSGCWTCNCPCSSCWA